MKTMAKPNSTRVLDLLGVPANLVAGFVVGVATPVAAIATLVAVVRMITGKVPFLSRVVPDENDTRQLLLGLVTPEEARVLWAEHKSSFGKPLEKLRLEIQSMAEQGESVGTKGA